MNPVITFAALVLEMANRDSLARWPSPEYQSLQATSYNRESKVQGGPGWFADSDGTGYIRKEGDDYVLMEHIGPGCITKMWTPFFYYDFNDRVGPTVQIYLDGSKTPVIDESLIQLVQGKGSIGAPWAAYSARAGNLYLPIPFAKSAKVMMHQKPFYFSVNYRAYPAGTPVQTFTPTLLKTEKATLDQVARQLTAHNEPTDTLTQIVLKPGETREVKLPKGSRAVESLQVQEDAGPRGIVLGGVFDGEETIWGPLRDFFCSADTIHPFWTFTRSVGSRITSRWTMPYRRSGAFQFTNLTSKPQAVRYHVKTKPWRWDERSMHFYARWRSDDVVPGTPFRDWNFLTVLNGRGVYVGDAWTVLNIRRDSWWGEGDEKIYVDDIEPKAFPVHFGTGSEDYYGWAGGVYPVKEDEFSSPFLANVKVGGLDGHTLGYNISTRTRGLDAIPFKKAFRFDMESSFGTDMREPWNLLAYSAVTFWYAFPGAQHNRIHSPNQQIAPLMTLEKLQQESDRIRTSIR